MANYMFLMQFHNDSLISTTDAARLEIISEVGSGVSLIGCVLTLSLLCFLPTKGDGMFIIGNMCMVMMAAQLAFIGAENTSYPDPVMCKIATALLHYFFLCIQFASLSYALYMWSKFKPQAIGACRKKGTYLGLIWLAPCVIVLLTLISRGHSYALSDMCWLPYEHQTRLAFLLPLAAILLINLAMYIVIIITRVKHDYKRGEPTLAICRHVFWGSLSLAPVLSLQWILGFSVTFDLSIVLQYLYVMTCSAQGLFLLMFHVLTNGQIRTGLCSKLSEERSDASSPSGSGPLTALSSVNIVGKTGDKNADKDK